MANEACVESCSDSFSMMMKAMIRLREQFETLATSVHNPEGTAEEKYEMIITTLGTLAGCEIVLKSQVKIMKKVLDTTNKSADQTILKNIKKAGKVRSLKSKNGSGKRKPVRPKTESDDEVLDEPGIQVSAGEEEDLGVE